MPIFVQEFKGSHKLSQTYEVKSEKKGNLDDVKKLEMGERGKSEQDFPVFNGESKEKKAKKEEEEKKNGQEEKKKDLEEKKNGKEKKIKSLKKKLRQIEFLEEKIKNGEQLSDQEREKMIRKKEFSQELESYSNKQQHP